MFRNLLLFALLLIVQTLPAQFIDFEEKLPSGFCIEGKGEVTLSSLYYKEGKKSLKWDFRPNSTLQVTLNTPLILDEKKSKEYGITLWIYNEKANNDSVRFEFLTPTGEIACHFSFRLASKGWRACWIGFQHMHGNKLHKTITAYRLIAPQYKGRLFLDRLTFPVKKVNDRTTPDQQMPTNNSLASRNLWHWCRVWQWEQYQYDLPLPASLTEDERKELEIVESRMDNFAIPSKCPIESISTAYKKFQKVGIHRSGKGYVGAPILAPDELKRNKGEISWNDIETLLSGFAYDAYFNDSQEALQNYFTVWAYAIDQGFAYGSGMGTNHHYGYQVRKIYTTAWMLRDAIWESSQYDDIVATLAFWAALQETRKPYQKGRDELLDSWHTLLQAKSISALMYKDERERVRALRGVSRWVSTSLQYTPGTIGGIKVDGTTFHHGGFYPAYTSDALGMLGEFVGLTRQTRYEVSENGRKILRHALQSMRNYSNLHEWGIGLGGRHPFKGGMKNSDIEAFAHLALAGDLSGSGRNFDYELAADYLCLSHRNTPEARYFKEQGIQPAQAPQGFFVYNYGAAGILRRNNWMVTLKGYNTDVWGSEIYTKDNRYGRYQSYGSVQIMNGSSRTASGYNENGWDWNRLPGTTTIHLPYELLDSPLPGTTMAHSRENFAGSSSLEGSNGVFAIKLMERNLKNFTPDFVARKSVFCFGNRMVCLGTGISNSNQKYHTETTLFQYVFQPGISTIECNGKQIEQIGHQQALNADTHSPIHLKDTHGNYYYVKKGTVKVATATQQSRHEKTRVATQGTFATAWIDHGTAPSNESYEYMVWIQPQTKSTTPNEAIKTYQVIQCDSLVHAVYDRVTRTTAYTAFEDFTPTTDSLFIRIPAETLIMYKNEGKEYRISVCDPNLNIAEKTYTTKEASRPIIKELLLTGDWQLSVPNQAVEVISSEGNTLLKVRCQHGIPVEFTLY